jgi:hypothetical protein
MQQNTNVKKYKRKKCLYKVIKFESIASVQFMADKKVALNSLVKELLCHMAADETRGDAAAFVYAAQVPSTRDQEQCFKHGHVHSIDAEFFCEERLEWPGVDAH